jgi:hypothetical protein
MLDEMRKEYLAKNPRNTNPLREAPADKHFVTANSYDMHQEHLNNFFAGVRARKPVFQDPIFGFRAAAPALLSNVSYFEKRIAEWDPVNLVEKGKVAKK